MKLDRAWQAEQTGKWRVQWEIMRLRGRRRHVQRRTLQQASMFAPVMLALVLGLRNAEGRPHMSLVNAVALLVCYFAIGLIVGFVSSRVEWRAFEATWEGRAWGDTPQDLRDRQRRALGRPYMLFAAVAALSMGVIAVIGAAQGDGAWLWLWSAICLAGCVYFLTEIRTFTRDNLPGLTLSEPTPNGP